MDIEIPPMGESISDVVIATFLKPDGALVSEGDEIVEIETDKVNQALYAPASGKLSWSVGEGDTVPIGQVIGAVDTSVKVEKKEESTAPLPPTPSSSPKQEEPPAVKATSPTSKLRLGEEEFLKAPTSQEAPKKQEVKKETELGNRKPLSPIRKTIAKRLVDSLHESAMLTTFNEADMTNIMQLRKKHQETFIKRYGVKLGFMSFFVSAVVSAMKAFPDFNAYLDGDEIVYRGSVDIGIAVGTERGLVVPIIRDADTLSLHEIEAEIVSYAEKARSGRIAISDLEGGGFTITNGGVYGSLLSTPILNPPQVGILGMHKIMERPVVENGEVVIRPMMYLALSYDHRLIDGKGAVGFLVHLKEVLEDPAVSLF